MTVADLVRPTGASPEQTVRATAHPSGTIGPDGTSTHPPGVGGRRPLWEMGLVLFVVAAPTVGVPLAAWLALGQGISIFDATLTVVLYLVSALGVTIGFHRLFTHKSFTANRPLTIMLAVCGSLALQGPLIRWVADHRRHHAFSDRDGDPHSPWRYGRSGSGLIRGLWHAHTGWLFDRERTSARRWAPDLLADRDVLFVHKAFPLIGIASLAGPTLLGYAVTGTLRGAIATYVWAGLVRAFAVHHVTWSINSLCHVVGKRPFETRDEASNVWWLALPSFGESWHNMHHADPRCARHGVERHQVDVSAGLIRAFEKAGWATDVRWPDEARLARLRRTTATARGSLEAGTDAERVSQ